RVIPKPRDGQAYLDAKDRRMAAEWAAYRAEVLAGDAADELADADRNLEHADAEHRRARIELYARTPYGPGSEHSWIRDSVVAMRGASPDAQERLNLHRAAIDRGDVEKFAVNTGTLGGLVPSTIEPWTAEAVAFGVRSTAPLAAALLRLDLPPVGMNAP